MEFVNYSESEQSNNTRNGFGYLIRSESSLYRLADFFEHQDTELLMGENVDSTSFDDTTVARAMDAVFDNGAEKVFSAVALRASCKFSLDKRYVHFDTTSVNVWGAYDQCSPDSENINVTFGYSKDHRPDLEQFLMKMLCVGRNIPILGGCEDGNKSDKTINTNVLSKISKHMATHGLEPGAFVYVADSAVVTEDNLTMIGDNLFLTRLPLNYTETSRVISEAIDERGWTEIGVLNETPTTAKRPPAIYHVAEKTVVLHKKEYRAVVVHSSAHDKRRTKRIEREVKASIKTISTTIYRETKQEYYCLADAQVAGSRFSSSGTELHDISVSIEEKIHYSRGRPAKNGR
ncbi:IS1634 family transposase, partial [bacterium]|nr:IS1634 family transposase [bacterium]